MYNIILYYPTLFIGTVSGIAITDKVTQHGPIYLRLHFLW